MIIRIFYTGALFLTPLLVCVGTMYGVFQDRIEKRKERILYVVFADIAVLALVVIVSVFFRPSISEGWYVVVMCLVAIIGCKFALRCQYTELLFVFGIVKCYMDSIFCISKLMQYYVTAKWFTSNSTQAFYVAYVAAFIVTAYPMWLFIRKLLRPLINKTEQMKFWYMAWMVPLFYYLLYRFAISPQYKSPEVIMAGTKRFLPILWIVVVFLSLSVMVKMMLEATYAVEEYERRRSVERQLTIQQEQYEKIQRGVEYAKKLNHDQRHHFLAMNGYAQSGDIHKLKQYLSDYQERILPKEYVMVCENYAINAVAQHMLQRAIRAGAKVDHQIDIGDDGDINQSDLVVVIGNLLENAAEACERQKDEKKFLRITAFWPSEHMLALVLSNSYSGTIEERNGILFSSKRRKEGIGINSVKEIVEKYHGITKIEYDNQKGVFEVSVLLNL